MAFIFLPVVLVLLLVALLAGTLVIRGKVASRSDVGRLRDARRSGSFATIAADFRADFPSPEVLHAVYDAFQRAAASHQQIEGLVVRADDNLAAVYDAHLVDIYNDLYDLDLRAVVKEAAAASGRRFPTAAESTMSVRLRTVRDVVNYLEHCPLLGTEGEASDAAG